MNFVRVVFVMKIKRRNVLSNLRVYVLKHCVRQRVFLFLIYVKLYRQKLSKYKNIVLYLHLLCIPTI